MDRRGREKTEQFTAYPETGPGVQLAVFQHYIITETTNAPPERIDTLKEVRTVDGRHVNRISDIEFEILDAFGEIRVKRR